MSYFLSINKSKQRQAVINNYDKLEKLSDRDRNIVKYHLGLGDIPHSLTETGEYFNLCHGIIGRITNRFIKNLSTGEFKK